MAEPTIVAMGGGGFASGTDNPLLDDYILSLTGKDEPRVCFVPTASGDASHNIVRFYSAYNRKRCRPSHLALIGDPPRDLEAFVMGQDVIYVGGGSTAVLLSVWRLHGLDRVLTKAWNQGVVLCGSSAGGLCWFQAGTTDSFSRDLTALTDGLGLLSGSFSPHYDAEPNRRPRFQAMVASGELPPGVAADEGVGLVYRGTELVEAVSSRPNARAWRVEKGAAGAVETAIETRYLGP